ncbi:unnamed protein product, partial [marine sediment metagenome]
KETCFILGSGPSMNKTPLNLLKNKLIFGCNTSFKLNDVKFSYYVVSDVFVWDKRYETFMNLGVPLFLPGSAARSYLSKKSFYDENGVEPIPLKDAGQLSAKKSISKDLTMGLYWSETVIGCAIQIAYYMGFDKVSLLGCDCDYSGVHHFDGSKTDYTRGGGASGDWSDVFNGYRICKKDFEEDGREIVNSTVGGKLEIFKRQTVEDVINEY